MPEVRNALSKALADGLYLRLDTTNDPLTSDLYIQGNLQTDGHLGVSVAPTTGHLIYTAETFTGTGTVVGIGNFPNFTPSGFASNVGYAVQGNIWFDTTNWLAGSSITCLMFYPAPNATNIGSAFLDLNGILTGGLINVGNRTITAKNITGIVIAPVTGIFGTGGNIIADIVRGIFVVSTMATAVVPPNTGVYGRVCGIQIDPQIVGVINQGLWMAGNGIGSDIVFGAGMDVTMYYDGTDFYLITDLQNPSDFLLDCGTEKTLELIETVWDDLRVPMQNTKINPILSEPAFTSWIDGLYQYLFLVTNEDDESLHFTVQMPHTYKEGTDLECHIHWSPDNTNTGNVKWELEYTLIDINGTFPASTTITVLDAADGVINKHQVTSFVAISGAGLNLSFVMVCRLTRLGQDVQDTFTGGVWAHEFDIHFEINTLGSRQEFIK